MVLQERIPQTPIDRTDEPDLGGDLIDPSRYTSPEFAQLEWDRMWTQVWLNAGRVSDIPEVGDYFTHEIGRESLIFMRTGVDQIKGFYNICPHRGSRLRPAVGCGHAEQIQCPFHLWTFSIDGALTHVPDEQHFVNGIPDDKRGLSEVRVETWAGFVWFNLNPDCEPLADFLGVIPSHLDPYRLEEYHMVEDYVIEWACNWKFAVDEFAEIYHVPGLHPQLLESLDHLGTPLDVYDGGKHSRQLIRGSSPDGAWTDEMAQSFGYKDRYTVTERQNESLSMVGLDPSSFAGDSFAVRAALIQGRRQWGEQVGLDYADWVDDQLVDDFHYMVFPNLTFNLTATGAMFFRPRPHPTDPNRCYWDYQQFARLPEGAPAPPRPDTFRGTANDIEFFEALAQDMAQAQIVQESYHSQGYSGILLNSEERRIRAMHKAIDGYIYGPDR